MNHQAATDDACHWRRMKKVFTDRTGWRCLTHDVVVLNGQEHSPPECPCRELKAREGRYGGG